MTTQTHRERAMEIVAISIPDFEPDNLCDMERNLLSLIAQALLEVERETVEKCAEVAENFHVDVEIMGIKVSNRFMTVHSEIATAIRLLAKEGK